jgi:hypothetical protein
MAKKNFKSTQGITLDSYSLPINTIQATVKTNSATTIDTVDLEDFNAIEYLISIKQGSKIRTSKFIVQTDGTSVDTTEYAITETGGAISGVVVAASASGTDMILQVTVTDAASTIARVVAEKNSNQYFVKMVPGSPTNVSAVGSPGTAVVSFDAPVFDGDSEILLYTVTSSTGGFVGTGTSSPITVYPITVGGDYTFTVQARNVMGDSIASSASNSVSVAQIAVLTGGTISSDSTYFYRTFTSSGTLSVSAFAVSGDVLVIGGGGGGGAAGGGSMSGGGGAGGLRAFTGQNLAPGSYTVTVGAGGGFGAGDVSSGASGSNSQFGSLTNSTGGGGGGRESSNANGKNGGCGGGGGDGGNNWGKGLGGTGSIGFNGGRSWTGSYFSGNNAFPAAAGGGGGMGSAGANAASATGGNGGNGTDSHASWLSAIAPQMSGVAGWTTATASGFIAGGGGGGGQTVNTGSGGSGGGTASSSNTNATTNTGSGGGGQRQGSQGGGSGGSGIVIVRYLKSAVGA